MKVIEKVDRSFWMEIAESCPYATYFHTPYWADLMAKTFFYIDITKGFIFDGGTKVIFPFMYRKRNILKGFLKDYVSGPLYVYGGPISDTKLSIQQIDEIIEYIKCTSKYYNSILIRGNPLTQNITVPGFRKVEDFSHVVKLFKHEDAGDFLKIYPRRYRDYVSKAERNNMLIVKEATTLEEYEKLYDIYQRSIKYWDVDATGYPLKLFQNLYYLKNKYIKFWVSYYKTKMIGGDITLCWNDHCDWWLSYYDRKYSRLRAQRYRLHIDYIDCKAKGIKFYDLGESAGISGLELFKESVGGGKIYSYCLAKRK